ncbi:putative helicase mov-10-B.1 [Phymastichus coffea]|uniref:putative helicase mov-10-B.1 n=1 Tax=Phymastichus coffea TaxID=108790 RepID=UPI00273AFABD|nr:putative helicase mov-10-B.1 [Phymastichus coffea]
MFRTKEGLNKQAHQTCSPMPPYPIPVELQTVLDINAQSELCRKSEMYSEVLQIIDPLKHVDLSECHYAQLLTLGLFLEEYQTNEEMKKRKLFNQTIKKLPVKDPNEILFSIRVEELDEEHAWIREGDFVDVIDTKMYKEIYTLRVARVTQTYIIASDDAAKLSKAFVPTNLYNINFRFQNYPLRCDHHAIWLTYKENTITYLFPEKAKPFINKKSQTYGTMTMINPAIESNPQQKQAVLHIVNKSSFPAPYILYGPPGTGKTATLVEAIVQIHEAFPLNCILVCTPSNTSADEIARRLLKYVNSSYLYRIYSQSRDKSTIDKELQNCSFFGKNKRIPLRREDIIGKKILISTLCTAMRFSLMKLNADYFSHIFIDEAGQGTEANVLIPISVASKDGKLHSQIILAGDPKQLGPTIISKLADKILGRSILERIMQYDIYQKDHYNNYNPKYITKLLHNYRNHPKIIQISNKLFYDNELISKYSNGNEKVNFPIIFNGVAGEEEQYSFSPSKFNYEEIRLVLRYVYNLIDNKTAFGEVAAKDIDIVTPFKLQSKRIKKILKKKDLQERKFLYKLFGKNIKLSDDDRDIIESEMENEEDIEEAIEEYIVKGTEEDIKKLKMQSGADVIPDDQYKYRNLKDINVGTVDLFQGQERKIMIMTAVRSKTFICNGKENIGFLSHPKRFNVAMTRAQAALIVIGNPDDQDFDTTEICRTIDLFGGLKKNTANKNTPKKMYKDFSQLSLD